MAYASGAGNIYSNVNVGAGGRTHLGNSYNYGPTEDQQILQSILQSLRYPEMGQRGRDVPDAGADTFEWLYEGCGSRTSHESDESDRDETVSIDDEVNSAEEAEREPDGEARLLDDGGHEHGIGENREILKEDSDHQKTALDSTYSEIEIEEESNDDYPMERLERDRMAAKLRCWLKEDGDSVFWVTGKQGSGKSTFMKFLRDHDGTDSLLREWAKDDVLIVADHFFWLPGTHLQKSFEGLARSLMHAILASLAADIASAKTI